MMLEDFINKNKELANQYIKCGSCANSLQHCGKYEIVKIGMGRGKRSEEGILCETCQKNGRQLVNVTKISDDNNHVFNYAVSQIDPATKKQEAEEILEDKEEQVESIQRQKEAIEEAEEEQEEE